MSALKTCEMCKDTLCSERETFGSHVAPYCSGCFHGYSETAQRMRIDGELARDYRRDEEKVDTYLASMTPDERAAHDERVRFFTRNVPVKELKPWR